MIIVQSKKYRASAEGASKKQKRQNLKNKSSTPPPPKYYYRIQLISTATNFGSKGRISDFWRKQLCLTSMRSRILNHLMKKIDRVYFYLRNLCIDGLEIVDSDYLNSDAEVNRIINSFNLTTCLLNATTHNICKKLR